MRYQFLIYVAILTWISVCVGQTETQQQEFARLVADQKLEEAEVFIENILKSDPAPPWATFQAGYLNQIQGKLDDAMTRYRECQNFHPLQAVCHYNMACAEIALGNPDQGLKNYLMALRSGFNDRDGASTDSDLDPIRGQKGFHLPSKIRFESFTSVEGNKVEFGLSLPRKLDPKTYPCLLAFSPGNMSKSAVETGFQYWWGQQAVERDWIVVAPIAPEGRWVASSEESLMKNWMTDLLKRYNIEGGKFHVAGCSGGGPSSYHVAVRFADRVHSLVGLPAHPLAADVNRLAALQSQSVFVVNLCGGNDAGWLPRVQGTHQVLVDIGVNSRMKIYEGEGHVIGKLRGGEFMKLMQKIRKRSKGDKNTQAESKLE